MFILSHDLVNSDAIPPAIYGPVNIDRSILGQIEELILILTEKELLQDSSPPPTPTPQRIQLAFTPSALPVCLITQHYQVSLNTYT